MISSSRGSGKGFSERGTPEPAFGRWRMGGKGMRRHGHSVGEAGRCESARRAEPCLSEVGQAALWKALNAVLRSVDWCILPLREPLESQCRFLGPPWTSGPECGGRWWAGSREDLLISCPSYNSQLPAGFQILGSDSVPGMFCKHVPRVAESPGTDGKLSVPYGVHSFLMLRVRIGTEKK